MTANRLPTSKTIRTTGAPGYSETRIRNSFKLPIGVDRSFGMYTNYPRLVRGSANAVAVVSRGAAIGMTEWQVEELLKFEVAISPKGTLLSTTEEGPVLAVILWLLTDDDVEGEAAAREALTAAIEDGTVIQPAPDAPTVQRILQERRAADDEHFMTC